MGSGAAQKGKAAMQALLPLSVLAAAVLAVLALRRLDVRPRTTDAIVTANTIQVVPEVAGLIATLNVKDDAVVRKGDVLFTIDQERYLLALAQAKAQVRALEAQIDLTNRTVSSQVTGVSVAHANAEAARARLKQASDTLVRMEPLLPDGYVTHEQVDLARTARDTAASELIGALNSTRQVRQAVGDSNALVAQLEGARALVGLAERDLRNTVVRAPFDGRIVGVTASVGQMVGPVKALFTLIDTSQWFIVADFRETELRTIRPGDRVTGYVMSAPGVHLRGFPELPRTAAAWAGKHTITGAAPPHRGPSSARHPRLRSRPAA